MHGGLREGAGRKAVEDKNKEISTHIKSVQKYNYYWQFWNQTSRGKLVRNAALDAANKITEYFSIKLEVIEVMMGAMNYVLDINYLSN